MIIYFLWNLEVTLTWVADRILVIEDGQVVDFR